MASIIFVLGLVILQDLFQFKKVIPLAGYYTNPKDVAFTWQDWKQGKYQQQKEEYLSKCFHLREDLVRLYNSIHYSLFKTSNIDWVVFGKQHQLMDKTQIDAYLGKDAIPSEEIKQITQYLKEIQDTLEKVGKHIFVVIPPNKPAIYPEYIPENFEKKSSKNNYELFTDEFSRNQIKYIDLHQYFQRLKSEGEKDLFAVSGSHWNSYGSSLALIYTIDFLNNYLSSKLGNFEIISKTYKKERPADLNIYVTLNLLSKKTSDTTLHPALEIKRSGNTPPKALFISDSFFDAWLEAGIYDLFDSTTYYFYNDRVITKDRVVTDIRFSPQQSLANNDLFIILCNESNMDELGWGFIQELHLYFFPQAQVNILHDKYYQKQLRSTMDDIKNDTAWYHNIEKKAALNNMFVDKQLYLDAIWIIQNKHKIAQQ